MSTINDYLWAIDMHVVHIYDSSVCRRCHAIHFHYCANVFRLAIICIYIFSRFGGGRRRRRRYQCFQHCCELALLGKLRVLALDEIR